MYLALRSSAVLIAIWIFGCIYVDWDANDPVVRCQVRDERGGVMLQQRLKLSQLRSAAK